MTSLIQDSILYFKDNGPTMLGKFFLGVAVFFVFYIIINRIVENIKSKIEKNSLVADVYSKKNSSLVGKILFTLLMIFNILATFQIIGFDVAIIMGGISLSLGFAMQSTIENLISGIFILTNQKIKLGEFIQFMGPLNMMGTIEEINVRYTVLRTFDKRRVIIPNSLIAKAPVRTMKSEPLLRGEVTFRVPRHAHIPQVKELFRNTINANKGVLYPEYTTIIITSFDTAGTNIKGYFYANPAKKSPAIIARDLKKKLFDIVKQYGIGGSYPHITVTVEE